MNEFEREERNPKWQKCASPENRVVCGRSKNETTKKIPILESDQKDDCLGNADEAKRGAFSVKPAKNAFPNKNQQATRACDTSDLDQGKENEKTCPKNEANPRLRCGADEPKENRSGHEEQHEVCECIEDHELQLWPGERLAKMAGVENRGKAPRRSTNGKAPNTKLQIPNKEKS